MICADVRGTVLYSFRSSSQSPCSRYSSQHWLNEVSDNPTNSAYIPSIFLPSDQRMNFRERLTNFLLMHYLSWQVHYYYYSNNQLKLVKKHFDMDLSHIKDLYYDISLYLVNSHHSLNEIRPMTTNVIEVGGLHLRDDDNSPSPVNFPLFTTRSFWIQYEVLLKSRLFFYNKYSLHLFIFFPFFQN